MKALKYVTEYLMQPFPEVQPDYWLKIELWQWQNEYLPVLYVRDAFKLPQTSLSRRRQHRKKYDMWVREQWGIFPEHCTIRDVPEEKVPDIVFEVIRCAIFKKELDPSISILLHHHDEMV